MIGAGLMGVLEGLSAVSGGSPPSGGSALLAMLSAAAEWVVAVLALGVLGTVFLTATVVSVLRNVSLPRDDRLAATAAWVEKKIPGLDRFDVSGRVEPTTESRRQNIKQQYISGEIGEAEFERRLSQLGENSSEESVSRPDAMYAVETEDESH